MAARSGKPKAKRMSAQLVEDEGYRLRCERVAGIDVAKASGMVCLRLPPAEGKARRTSRTWETGATVPEIAAVAGELAAAGVAAGAGVVRGVRLCGSGRRMGAGCP